MIDHEYGGHVHKFDLYQNQNDDVEPWKKKFFQRKYDCSLQMVSICSVALSGIRKKFITVEQTILSNAISYIFQIGEVGGDLFRLQAIKTYDRDVAKVG